MVAYGQFHMSTYTIALQNSKHPMMVMGMPAFSLALDPGVLHVGTVLYTHDLLSPTGPE